ncbi:MAG: mechanosensitive ion channel family protein [Candidatus Aenigmarchaeota archaeon]|nr:mechanosensitive ion channel family protein [Candidatus Aenigmarchaeota archaeon]
MFSIPYISPYFSANPHLHAIVIFAFFFIVSRVVVFASEKLILRLTKKTKTELDDMIIKRTNKPVSVILIFIGIRLALDAYGLSEAEMVIANRIFSSLIALGVAYIIIAIFDVLVDNWANIWSRRTASKMDDYIVSLMHRIIRVIILIFTLLYILYIWGVEITAMLAGLGVAGIAVAFAMQSTLSNIFGGIFMLIDKAIKVGDVIELDDKTSGTVLDIGLRSTRIKTWDNEVLIIPNGKMADARIVNYTEPDLTARTSVIFSVAYGSDVDKVKKIVMKEIKAIEGVKAEPEPIVYFQEMGQSSLNFKAYFWMDDFTKRFRARDEANTRIYNALRKAGIKIPFPQMDVHVKK